MDKFERERAVDGALASVELEGLTVPPEFKKIALLFRNGQMTLGQFRHEFLAIVQSRQS